jgi:archaeal flagellar protein FlaJ
VAGPPLFRTRRDPRRVARLAILAASAAVALLLLVPAAILFSGRSLGGIGPSDWIHFFCLGLLAAIGPYGFHAAGEARRIRHLEQRFPDFLRDIASSHQGGMTLPNAVSVASRGEYGPLTPEVRRMADQLSWNVPFDEALVRFAQRVDTPLVHRAVNLILEANHSGGATTEVLLAAARDAREIKTLETERTLSMGLYTIVIYITFLVFLAVAAVMYAQFVPQLVASSAAVQGGADTLGPVAGLGGEQLRTEDFQLFYFMAAVMQGLGDGVVAGLMGTGRAALGLRHSFVMVLLSYLTFVLFLG